MDAALYESIFKRKSFHVFGELAGSLSQAELDSIQSFFAKTERLDPSIKVEMDVVKGEEITSARGAEYALIFYSEKKANYLMNVGYIGEQLDLYLTHRGIGTLWYGIGRKESPKNTPLSFVIMILIGKKREEDFRKDMFLAKRKKEEEIWPNDNLGIASIVRFSPSACNTQNWFVKSQSNALSVYRVKPTKRGIMPASKVTYCNRIDLGIFLVFLELCLSKRGTSFIRETITDEGMDEKALVAVYHLRG